MNEQEIQQQVEQLSQALMQGDQQAQQWIKLVSQAAMEGDEQSQQWIQLVSQAAQQGDEQADQICQFIQQAIQQIQGQQIQKDRFGAKLNYIKYLRGQCPNGYEMQSFKKGGAICKKCVKKALNGEQLDTVSEFKKGRKIQAEKCGGKAKLKRRKAGGQLVSKSKKSYK